MNDSWCECKEGVVCHRCSIYGVGGLRDQFAMAVASEMIKYVCNRHIEYDCDRVAKESYKLSDAMLVARKIKDVE